MTAYTYSDAAGWAPGDPIDSISSELIREARDWAEGCSWREEPDDIEDYPDHGSESSLRRWLGSVRARWALLRNVGACPMTTIRDSTDAELKVRCLSQPERGGFLRVVLIDRLMRDESGALRQNGSAIRRHCSYEEPLRNYNLLLSGEDSDVLMQNDPLISVQLDDMTRGWGFDREREQ